MDGLPWSLDEGCCPFPPTHEKWFGRRAYVALTPIYVYAVVIHHSPLIRRHSSHGDTLERRKLKNLTISTIATKLSFHYIWKLRFFWEMLFLLHRIIHYKTTLYVFDCLTHKVAYVDAKVGTNIKRWCSIINLFIYLKGNLCTNKSLKHAQTFSNWLIIQF